MIYLIAGNGTPNFGDELIVKYWVDHYRANGYAGPIVVDGKGAEHSARLMPGAEGVSFVTRIPRHSGGRDGSYASFADLGRAYARDALDSFRGVRLLHMLGGGYVSGNWPNATRLVATVAEIATQLDIPALATGLGLAPLRPIGDEDAAAWRDAVAAFRAFEVRDKSSYKQLLQLTGETHNLIDGLDDVFLNKIVPARADRPTLHLSLYAANVALAPAFLAQIAQLIGRFGRTLFWTCSPADSEIFAHYAGKFPGIVECGNDTLLSEGVPVAPGDFMLTQRFHPHWLCSATM